MMRVSGYAAAGQVLEPAPVPLVTLIGIVSGEVLQCLSERGPSTLRDLNLRLSRSTRLVLMAVGALLRSGAVQERNTRGVSVLVLSGSVGN